MQRATTSRYGISQVNLETWIKPENPWGAPIVWGEGGSFGPGGQETSWRFAQGLMHGLDCVAFTRPLEAQDGGPAMSRAAGVGQLCREGHFSPADAERLIGAVHFRPS